MGLRVRKQLVAASIAKGVTYGTGNRKVGITIHETANTSKGADAAAHANLQSRGNSRSASWHWTVDDTEAVQSFSHAYRCWHAGSGSAGDGDDTIAIEIAVNSDGDYGKAVRNAALLVRHIRATDPAVGDGLFQHNFWSGKDCPNYLREGRVYTWSDFGGLVEKTPRPITTPSKPGKGKPSFNGKALQRAVGADDDNINGPDTRCRINAVRQASRWGGNDFPYGLKYAQRVVGTRDDGVWGKRSAAAHDRTVAEIQLAVGAYPDGVWGPETERKVNAYLRKMRTV